ncbi:hypothetical protein [Streptomyces sp. NBC_00878]|uniref:hypothetical protein n=1 Tax=Streptomyces sp. NBC_00878 TaxID=2975854 RepID=UPI00224E10EB|nr:hypothetical protein [Streptomyces sp. NBC_00878]MCX4906915.1 hypothetical protein [Streptomyces sp. NBC_00878]
MSAHRTISWGVSAARAAPVVCLLVLTACGGSGGDETASGTKEVASLPSSGAPSASASASKGGGGSDEAETSSGRPQMRLDMTDQERQVLIYAWNACLVKHGAHYTKPVEREGPKKPGWRPGVADPIPQSAAKACRNKLPLGAPELDPERNPHYRDDWVANVKCLRDHGMRVHLTEDNSAGRNGLTWTYDDDSGSGVPDDQQPKIVRDCELAAFGGKK